MDLQEAKVDRHHDLALFVVGTTPRMRQAYANLKTNCACHLGGRYHVTVVDLLRHPECATREQIVAVPTLIWKTPSGMHTIVGDFSNHEKVLVGLEILPREDERHA